MKTIKKVIYNAIILLPVIVSLHSYSYYAYANDTRNVDTHSKETIAQQLEFKRKAHQILKRLSKEQMKRLLEKSHTIIGLELIIVEEIPGNFFSQFGHVGLRLVDSDNNFLNDTVIHFTYFLNDISFSYIKGLLGSNIGRYTGGLIDNYQTMLMVEPFIDFWNTYISQENRKLERYIFPSNHKLRQNIIKLSKNIINNSRPLKPYNPIGNNCINGLVNFLKEAGFHFNGLPPVIPVNFAAKSFTKSLLNLYPQMTVKTFAELLNRTASTLNISTVELRLGINWPTNSEELLTNKDNFSNLELDIILQEIYMMPLNIRKTLTDFLKDQSAPIISEEMLSVIPCPEILYQACTNLHCAKKIIEAEKNTFDKDQIKKAYKRRQKAYNNILPIYEDSNYGEGDIIIKDNFHEELKNTNNPMLRHLELLLKSNKLYTDNL